MNTAKEKDLNVFMATQKKQQDSEEIVFEVGGDNIFADIGVANAEEEFTKAELACETDQLRKHANHLHQNKD